MGKAHKNLHYELTDETMVLSGTDYYGDYEWEAETGDVVLHRIRALKVESLELRNENLELEVKTWV